MLLQPVTATQSSTHAGFSASKCIDGDITGPDSGFDDRGDDLCHTNEEPAPWIALDFGKTVVVNRVEIFNRALCCGDRTRNVDVHISNQLPTSSREMLFDDTLFGHFAGPATNGQHIIISGEEQQFDSHY